MDPSAALVIAVAAGGLAYGLAHNWVRSRRRVPELTRALAVEHGLSHEARAKGAVLRGQVAGRQVEIDVAPDARAIVRVPISSIPLDVRIYETSAWGYHKIEDRQLGVTVDTGEVAFDARFDVHGSGTLSRRVRRVLVAHHRRGLAILDGHVTIGSGRVTPFGYVSQGHDTLAVIDDMIRAATALARDLDR